ncbi:RNA editing complex protein MP67 [Trypanosoma brucei gambiense DAL972]|uniref:RNA editing complex protein MP67 n=1 Tax=Trypanosoma brucei gambiense (strain MHOM/CI/86/DAL972) TaxID=679716 RepID=D0A2S0_TRYB9|nr:RNA editing complex protein MP67 [Trypanosoma brucei gambiense DAL972]CBH15564.1 RNA editing complex protein MP67 [Trypanosoma brucei gambiense DAL972]|eukprot:XP_011777828.1 RNA editing complex protein MP67 [Trypanosoma brucei gambiense DAL972]
MRNSLIQHTRNLSATKQITGIVCDHVDVFTWGHSPPEQHGNKFSSGKATAPFYNAGQRRCTLCDDRLETSFSAHCGYVGHVARVGILERAMEILQKGEKRAANGKSGGLGGKITDLDESIKALVGTWWSRLNDTKREPALDYKRIPSLSASTTKKRLWRMRFLLQYLRDRGIIRYSLTPAKVAGAGGNAFVRSARFERSEMIGDNIVKVVVPDRLVRLFPADEGGVTYKLASIQQLLDSNEGLLEIYDYLGLNNIIGVRLPNNKTKSDVVEALFGELQTFLWASELSCGSCQYPAFPTAEHRYVRALVDHLLNELTHMVIMWRVESTLENSKEYLAKYLLQGARQNGSFSTSASGATIVKEVDCDRSRYAVLPLLLTFPYSTSSANKSAGGKQPPLQSSSLAAAKSVQERGTPRMLFTSPVAVPAALHSHYNPPLRIVRTIKDYQREILTVLEEEEVVSALIPCTDSSWGMKEGYMNSRETGRRKPPHGQIRAPWHELALEKYPRWRCDTEEAVVRQALELRLMQRKVYTKETNWRALTTAMAQRLLPNSPLEVDPVGVRPVRQTGRLLLTFEGTTERRAALATSMCFPSLAQSAG